MGTTMFPSSPVGDGSGVGVEGISAGIGSITAAGARSSAVDGATAQPTPDDS